MKKVMRFFTYLIFYIGVIGGGIALIVYQFIGKPEPDYKKVANIAGVLVVYLLTILSTRSRQKKQAISVHKSMYDYIIRDSFSNNNKAYKKLMKAILCYNQDDLRKAVKILEKLEPECVSVNEYVAVHDFEALCYMESEDYAKAIRIYEEILKRDSFFADAYNNLGNCYLEEGKLGKAIEILEQGTHYNSQDAFVYANLSAAYGRQGDAQKSLEFAEKAMELDSSVIEAISSAAVAAKMLGDVEKMEKYRDVFVLNGGDREEIDEDLLRIVGKV